MTTLHLLGMEPKCTGVGVTRVQVDLVAEHGLWRDRGGLPTGRGEYSSARRWISHQNEFCHRFVEDLRCDLHSHEMASSMIPEVERLCTIPSVVVFESQSWNMTAVGTALFFDLCAKYAAALMLVRVQTVMKHSISIHHHSGSMQPRSSDAARRNSSSFSSSALMQPPDQTEDERVEMLHSLLPFLFNVYFQTNAFAFSTMKFTHFQQVQLSSASCSSRRRSSEWDPIGSAQSHIDLLCCF